MFKDPKFPDSMSENCKEFISKALEKVQIHFNSQPTRR